MKNKGVYIMGLKGFKSLAEVTVGGRSSHGVTFDKLRLWAQGSLSPGKDIETNTYRDGLFFLLADVVRQARKDLYNGDYNAPVRNNIEKSLTSEYGFRILSRKDDRNPTGQVVITYDPKNLEIDEEDQADSLTTIAEKMAQDEK